MAIINMTLVSTAAKRRILGQLQAGQITDAMALRQLEALSLVGLANPPTKAQRRRIPLRSIKNDVPNGWGWREQA